MGSGFLTQDELVSRIIGMRTQEDTYAYKLFLHDAHHDGEPVINASWREKICQWSYNVVDHFSLSREVVAVSLHLFDRYMATRGNRCCGNLALLSSLTTLHLAIKLHETRKVKLSTLASLSRGQFQPKDIVEMEWTVLFALEFKLHPPTQYAFVSHFLLFLPQEANPAVRRELSELARYLTELAICDEFFVTVKSSTVSFAAILNVMEDLSYARLSAGTRERFLRNLYEHVGLSCGSGDIIAARLRLRSMLAASQLVDDVQSGHQLSSDSLDGAESMSMAGSMASSSSLGSKNSRAWASVNGRSTGNSAESASMRFSPSSHRRFVTSPMGTSRARTSSSPTTAGLQ